MFSYSITKGSSPRCTSGNLEANTVLLKPISHVFLTSQQKLIKVTHSNSIISVLTFNSNSRRKTMSDYEGQLFLVCNGTDIAENFTD